MVVDVQRFLDAVLGGRNHGIDVRRRIGSSRFHRNLVCIAHLIGDGNIRIGSGRIGLSQRIVDDRDAGEGFLAVGLIGSAVVSLLVRCDITGSGSEVTCLFTGGGKLDELIGTLLGPLVAVVADEVTKLSIGIKELVGDVNKSMEGLQTSSENLTHSLLDVQDALDASRTQMNTTENIFSHINDSVSGVENVHRGINEVVENCSGQVDQLREDMEAHETRYAQVQSDIDGLKSLMTEKGFIYEDISNMMEQADPLIENIKTELNK